MKKLITIALLISMMIVNLSACFRDKIPEEDDMILDAKDFCYTDKDKGFTIWLGMDKEEALSILGPVVNEESIYQDDEGENIDYYYPHVMMTFGYNIEKLISINPRSDIFDNWESYGGLTRIMTKDKIIEILGQPTYISEYDNLWYAFYPIDNNKYKKIRSFEELNERTVTDKQIREVIEFSFGNEEEGYFSFSRLEYYGTGHY